MQPTSDPTRRLAKIMSHLEENTLARLESTVPKSRGILTRFQRFWNSPSALSIMYFPVLILFLIFIVYPLIQGIKLSTTNWDGFSPTFTWANFDQYKRMFNDRIV